jgi:hypothetical protein
VNSRGSLTYLPLLSQQQESSACEKGGTAAHFLLKESRLHPSELSRYINDHGEIMIDTKNNLILPRKLESQEARQARKPHGPRMIAPEHGNSDSGTPRQEPLASPSGTHRASSQIPKDKTIKIKQEPQLHPGIPLPPTFTFTAKPQDSTAATHV